MSLQAVLEKIQALGEAQVQEIEQNAQVRINEVLAQARADAAQIEKDACTAASAPAIAERARILHRARLEALRLLGNAREELVDIAINRVTERLMSFRNHSLYPSVLQGLLEEAITAVNKSSSTGTLHLIADRRDEPLIKNILVKRNGQDEIKISYELHCWGGVIVKSENERIAAINTLESRLERARPFLRRRLASIFEAEQPSLKSANTIATHSGSNVRL